MHTQPATDNGSDDLFRTSVMVSRTAMQKLRVVCALEGRARDEVIRDLIEQRVAEVELKAAA